MIITVLTWVSKAIEIPYMAVENNLRKRRWSDTKTLLITGVISVGAVCVFVV
jgi:hypothetical protein